MITPPPLPRMAPAQTPPPLPGKQKSRKWRIPVLSILVCCVVFVIGCWFWYVAKHAMDSIGSRSAKREHKIEPPVYETLLGEELSGSGFHFKVGNAVYICASLHQFDGKAPKVMSSFEFDPMIEIKEVVHRQTDVQVLSFRSDELNQIAPLTYLPGVRVDAGHPIYIYSDAGIVKGHVSWVGKTSGTIMIRMTEPFYAAGQSGGPIVSGETGSVIAVLIGANDAEQATRVEAELLRLPLSMGRMSE